MARTIYRWDEQQKKLVEVGGDYVPSSDSRNNIVSDLYMDGVRATDGTDIGSRRKRKEYMKARGLVDTDDCKGIWEKARKERDDFYSGNWDTEARRRDIVESMRELKHRR